eukprot:11868158-Ditylum_brightwellii.AAC.1
MVVKIEILPQSLVVIVINNHEADNQNDESDGKNKDDADTNWPILASLPVENRLSCRWLVVWEGGQIVNVMCTGAWTSIPMASVKQDRTGWDRTGHFHM